LKHFVIDGETYELGGDAWASPNVIMEEIASELNVTLGVTEKKDANDVIAIWLGGSNWTTVDESISPDSAEMLLTMFNFIVNLSDNYSRYLKTNMPFLDVHDFFEPYDVGITRTMKTFLDSRGITTKFRFTDVIPIIRTIYDQEEESNAFAGMVSLVPLVASSYSVKDGNSVLVEKLFQNSSANLFLSTTVTAVTKMASGYKISVSSNFPIIEGEYQNKNSEKFVEDTMFDAVVVATPLESSRGVKFVNIPQFNFPMRNYKKWYVTYVVADGLNSTFFGINPVPNEILTSTGGDNLPFVMLSFRGTTARGQKIYKTFSVTPLDPHISSMYLNPGIPTVQYWPQTFPDLAPLDNYQPILLDDNVFYINTIESTATAMEASALGGRNIALMYSQKLSNLNKN